VIFTWTAATPASDEQVVLTGNELLLARNVGASPHTITINSTPDTFGRSQNITAESIAAGQFRVYGAFARLGWIQSDGNLYFEADNAEVEFAVIKL
jgi:hypothetical protein